MCWKFESVILQMRKEMFMNTAENFWDDVASNFGPAALSSKYIGYKMIRNIRKSKNAFKIFTDFFKDFKGIYRNFGETLKNYDNVETAVNDMMKMGEKLGFDYDFFANFQDFLPILGTSKMTDKLVSQQNIRELLKNCPNLWWIRRKRTSENMRRILIVAILKLMFLAVIGTVKSVVDYEIDTRTGIFIGFYVKSTGQWNEFHPDTEIEGDIPPHDEHPIKQAAETAENLGIIKNYVSSGRNERKIVDPEHPNHIYFIDDYDDDQEEIKMENPTEHGEFLDVQHPNQMIFMDEEDGDDNMMENGSGTANQEIPREHFQPEETSEIHRIVFMDEVIKVEEDVEVPVENVQSEDLEETTESVPNSLEFQFEEFEDLVKNSTEIPKEWIYTAKEFSKINREEIEKMGKLDELF